MTPAAIVSKLWNYCNVLRDDLSACEPRTGGRDELLMTVQSAEFGVSGKEGSADERTKPPYNQPSAVPAKYNWPMAFAS